MRYIIFTILMLIIASQQSEAKGLSVDVLAGYAHHYTPYSGYNDRTFKNNLTSDVALLSINYSSLSLIGLSDSQGNASFAFINRFHAHTNRILTLNMILGVYALRSDNEPHMLSPELSTFLPTISVGSREFTLLPLIGVELDVPLNNNVSINTTFTMSFVLTGLKISF